MNHYELGALINCYSNEFLDHNFKHEKTLENCIEISKILLYNGLYFSENNGSCFKNLEKFIFQIVSDINEDFGKPFTVPYFFDTTPGSNLRLNTPNIRLTSTKDLVVRQLKMAKTDSDNRIYYDIINKPGISNLLDIFSFCSRKSIEQLEIDYKMVNNYENFKMDCAESVNKFLGPIQKTFYEIRPDEDYLEKILKFGANKAKIHADEVLTRVKEEIGLL
jgi:tryptophanyl-tRNA synthetase